MTEKVDWKAKYDEAEKQIKALKLQIELLKKQTAEKNITQAYEEKTELTELLNTLFGRRPTFGGGTTLRWTLQRDLVKQLFREKEGSYDDLIRNFCRQHGLNRRTFEERYIIPLVDDDIIRLFEAKNETRWKWIAKVK